MSIPQKTKQKSQVNNLTYYLKELEKEQTRPKVGRRKEINQQISEEINIIEAFLKKEKEKLN